MADAPTIVGNYGKHRTYEDIHAAECPQTGQALHIPGKGFLVAWGTTVPADGSKNYATGCLFIKHDGGNNTALYVNEGTEASSDFNPIPGITQQAALTAQDTSTVDATYGAQEQAVIINNRTRIAEIEAALQSIGLLP